MRVIFEVVQIVDKLGTLLSFSDSCKNRGWNSLVGCFYLRLLHISTTFILLIPTVGQMVPMVDWSLLKRFSIFLMDVFISCIGYHKIEILRWQPMAPATFSIFFKIAINPDGPPADGQKYAWATHYCRLPCHIGTRVVVVFYQRDLRAIQVVME